MALKIEINNCCGCIPLKPGVVIITVLWLLDGIFVTIWNTLYLISDSTFKTQYLAPIIIYGLVTLGAAFGLFVLTFRNTSKMLFIYSKISAFIATIIIINSFSNIMITVNYKTAFLRECGRSEDTDVCIDEYNFKLMIYIFVSVIQAILSIYFSMVVSAYARKKNAAAAAAADQHPYGQTSDDMTSVSY